MNVVTKETEQEGWSKGKATWLCVHAPQHNVPCVAAPSGEHSERAPLTSAGVGHKRATTLHTQPATTTGLRTGSKLGNSLINIGNLNVELMKDAQVNEEHAMN